MKVKILAVLLLILVAGATLINTCVLLHRIDRITDTVYRLNTEESAESAEKNARAAFTNFRREEEYLSLTVNHNDLTDIEGLFSEMIGYLSVSDRDGAEVAKSRLIDALSHLRRLSGCNISSVF